MNDEIRKIVTEALVAMVSEATGMRPPTDQPLPGFIQAPIDRAVERIMELFPVLTQRIECTGTLPGPEELKALMEKALNHTDQLEKTDDKASN